MKKLRKWFCAALAAAILAAAPAALAATPTPAPTETPEPTPTATPSARELKESEGQEQLQINVTAPLYVAMYAYGKTGKVVVPSEDAYRITNNNSDFAVEVTSIKGTNGVMSLTDSVARQDAGELYLQLSNVPEEGDDSPPVAVAVTDEETPVSWLVPESTDEGAGSLSIKIGARIGSNVNATGTKRACSVQYTFAARYTYDYVEYELGAATLENENDRELFTAQNETYGLVPEPQWVKEGSTFLVPNMALDGYNFEYWVTSEDGTPSAYTAQEENRLLHDTELYARWTVDHAGRLHVSSDYLTEANPTYTVKDWENGLDIVLYNYEKENVSLVTGDDLTYTVTATVNGATGTAQTGTLTAGTAGETTVHIARGTGGDWTAGRDVLVTMTASYNGSDVDKPVTKTLSATFHLDSTEYPTYSVTDQNDGSVLLVIDSNDYTGNITLSYGTAVVPDSTSSLRLSGEWTDEGAGGIIRVMPNRRYELLFLKTGSGEVRTTEGSSAKESSPEIGLTKQG